jgi:adenylate cyclase
MAAYECMLAAKILAPPVDRQANVEALRMLDRAIALDWKSAHAHAWKAVLQVKRG